MADFRRWILAFAALVLVVGLVAPASAQVTCTASSTVVPTMRHEGFTELTGDILLSCTATTGAVPLPAGSIIPTADVTVSLSAPVTSRVLGATGITPLTSYTEALLLVNDPAPANQIVCLDPTNPAVGCQQYAGDAANPNVFQGLGGATVPGPYTVTFLGIPADPPATSRTYRITNVRIDATTVALGTGVAGTTPVYAFVSASPSSSINIPISQVTVGYVGWGLLNTEPTSKGVTLFQCENYGPPAGLLGSVTFTENFATAFKLQGATTGSSPAYPQNTPGQIYYTESGLEIAVVDGEAGYADAPTELEATIANIPAGAVISVDTYAVSTGQALCAPTAPPGCVNIYSNANLLLPTANPTPGSNTPTVVADNSKGTSPISVTVVWQITATNPQAIDSLTFNVYGTLVAQVGNPTLLTGPATVAIGFYPQEASYPAPSSGPIPSFSSTVEAQSPTPVDLFTLSPCETILLFPYVTDYTGFDTGIAISNTSLDSLPSGQTAIGQTGACTITFFGAGGVAKTIGTSGVVTSSIDTSLTTGLIPPGTTWAFSLSTQDSGYGSTPTYGTVGYAIAVCDFQYAHGYSFVSDYGLRNFAAAYLALVIPDAAPRSAEPFVCPGSSISCSLTGEQLVH